MLHASPGHAIALWELGENMVNWGEKKGKRRLAIREEKRRRRGERYKGLISAAQPNKAENEGEGGENTRNASLFNGSGARRAHALAIDASGTSIAGTALKLTQLDRWETETSQKGITIFCGTNLKVRVTAFLARINHYKEMEGRDILDGEKQMNYIYPIRLSCIFHIDCSHWHGLTNIDRLAAGYSHCNMRHPIWNVYSKLIKTVGTRWGIMYLLNNPHSGSIFHQLKPPCAVTE
jgi:hypothetical protein